jgi:isopentenyl-diphosphate delta-isomerase
LKEQTVVLVNTNDEAIGTMGKMEAHQKGLLHRAFSVFIFDRQGSMLLQQRSAEKYHGALLWTNACCSHPYDGEDPGPAAERRLQEELGFRTPLKKIFSFIYRAQVENDLIEHEYDHVFAGEYEGSMAPDAQEVAALKYANMREIGALIQTQPELFTSWFKIAFPKIEEWWLVQYGAGSYRC